MERRDFLKTAGLTAAALSQPLSLFSQAANKNKPNVLFIAVDDMCDWITPMGYKQAVTPNLERLAKKGITFQNGHTAGAYCAPSRASIFTGQFASTTGCYGNQLYFYNHPNLKPMQVVFNESGYKCYGAGKLFHHPKGQIDQRGWTDYYFQNKEDKKDAWNINSWTLGTDIIPKPYPNSKFNRLKKQHNAWFLEWGKVLNEHEEDMADTRQTEYAVAKLKEKHDSPVFIGVGLYAPHFPNYCPEKYFDLYDRDKIEPPPYKKDDLVDLPHHIRRAKTARGRIHRNLEEIDAVKDAIHGYLACISYADAMLGRLLDALEGGPNADNTVIVFWSDHGYHHGEKFDWGKHNLWERTSNVPYLWAGPGVAKGKSIDTTVSLIDLFPTLTDLCGVPDNGEREGVSLAPMLLDPSTAVDRNVYFPGLRPMDYAIINQNHRYIHYSNDTEELYDVQKDPNEWQNIAGSKAAKKIIKKMKKSAPKNYASPGIPANRLKLVTEGDTFHWEKKQK